MNVNDINKILGTIINPDIARLAMPRQEVIENLAMVKDITLEYNSIVKDLTKSVGPQLKYSSDLASKMTAIAQALEKQYRPQISVFQSITQKLQPLIFHQTKWEKIFSSANLQNAPLNDAIIKMSSVNGFQICMEVYEEFGGTFNPEEITEEEIERAFEEHHELITEFNDVVHKAEMDGVSPGDIHGLIYSLIMEKLPSLSKKTYTIIVLIFTTFILAYTIYSSSHTDKKIDENERTLQEVVPKLKHGEETLKVQSKELEEIKVEHIEVKNELVELNTKVDSANSVLHDLDNDFENFQEEMKSKIDLILEEMNKHKDKPE